LNGLRSSANYEFNLPILLRISDKIEAKADSYRRVSDDDTTQCLTT
jgi:hypothetical protein